MGANQLMLRIENEDPAFGPWYAWLVYEQADSGRSIPLMQILIPDYETKADSALAIPDGYEQVPYYAFRWDSYAGAYCGGDGDQQLPSETLTSLWSAVRRPSEEGRP